MNFVEFCEKTQSTKTAPKDSVLFCSKRTESFGAVTLTPLALVNLLTKKLYKLYMLHKYQIYWLLHMVRA